MDLKDNCHASLALKEVTPVTAEGHHCICYPLGWQVSDGTQVSSHKPLQNQEELREDFQELSEKGNPPAQPGRLPEFDSYRNEGSP